MSGVANVQGMSQSLVKNFPGVPSDWDTAWSTLSSADGSLKLFYLIHQRNDLQGSSDSAPVRVLVIVHGQGEHCGRYLHFPHYLKDTVDLIVTMDHRGHGRSEGVRGHVDSFDQYVEDLRGLIHQIQERLIPLGRRLQFHLFGHSMGGLISLMLLQKYNDLPFRSVTLSAPLLGLKFEVPFLKRALGHALSRVLGGVQLETGLNPELVSHDPEVVQAYCSDGLVHNKATARFFTAMLSAIKKARVERHLTVPVQFIIPLADGMVSSEITLAFAEELIQSEKRVVTYEGFFHESFNEVEKERAFADLSLWIQKNS